MHENDLQVFIDGTMHYFKQTSQEAAMVGMPYLLDNSATICHDYTGIIGFPGGAKGASILRLPVGCSLTC